jgi:SMC interacting uncharacterized protein involved in chromosome segregation
MIQLGNIRFTIVPRSSKMKDEILAKINALQAQRDELQTKLQQDLQALDAEVNAETVKLNKLMAEIPPEFHNLTQEVFDKLKEYFS